MNRVGWLLLLMVAGHAAARSPVALTPYVQTRPDGFYIDWLEGYVGGYGRRWILHDMQRDKRYARRVRQQTLDDGRMKVLATLAGIYLEDGRTLIENREVYEKVRAFVNDFPAEDSRVISGSHLEARMRLPLYGGSGLMAIVLDSGPLGIQAADGDGPGEAADVVTGLIVDASDLEGEDRPAPALFPRIVDEDGREIYSRAVGELEAVLTRGLMRYAVMKPGATGSGEEPDPSRPLGPRPLRIKALGTTGSAHTDLVISRADGDRVLEAARNADFLARCHVVTLMDRSERSGAVTIRRRSNRRKVTPTRPEPEDPNKYH